MQARISLKTSIFTPDHSSIPNTYIARITRRNCSNVDIRSAVRALAFTLAVLSPSFAAAQSAPTEIDVSHADISGIRLGMTPDQVVEAVKAFDPLMEVKKKYLAFAPPSFSFAGDELKSMSPHNQKFAYLNAVTGSHITGVSFETNGCFDPRIVDLDTINVEFSRTPGNEKVIAISREKIFCKEPYPSVAAITGGILAKYPEALATYRGKNGYSNIYGWLFDAHSRPVTAATAKSKGIPQTSGIPFSVKSGDGFGLNAVVVASPRNTLLVDRFSVTLYDATGLYDSVAQGKAAFQALKARADAEELKNNENSQPQTKF